MKKVSKEKVEKMAEEKNIDKDKIKENLEKYEDKSQDELMDELTKIGENLKGKEEIMEKFKMFLDDKQKKKLDNIMSKLASSDAQKKVQEKKAAKKTQK
jgi:hypothetical protein